MNKEARIVNSSLVKVAVQCSASTCVVNQTLVLRINICGENRYLRQADNRCQHLFGGTTTSNELQEIDRIMVQNLTHKHQHLNKRHF